MKHGFSLIELSIVLVILGLLTGGILAGKSLIRASELRAVTTEYNRYVTAAHAFKDKYFYLPGDIPNASDFWGAADGNDGKGADCRLESSTTATCNGDGDGHICIAPGACNGGGSTATFEAYLVWKHLANAGLIEGTYSGYMVTVAGTLCSNPTYQYLAGCNAPASKLSSGAWITYYLGTTSSHAYVFDGDYGNMLNLAASPTGGMTQPILKAEELWNIDTKMDDGKPASGKLVVARWNFCTTGAANQADGVNASYVITSTTLVCSPVFRNVY
jgi:prepilin-type N-terminal cleavage/methylation domain-containing protein